MTSDPLPNHQLDAPNRGAPDSASIEALAKRLEALEQQRSRHNRAGSPKRRQSMRDAGKGMKIATEFVCAVLLGALLGGAIDWLLGTPPWFMLIFFCLGSAAGFKNAYGAAIGEGDDPLAGYRAFNVSRTKTTKTSLPPRTGDGKPFDPLADKASDVDRNKIDGD